MWKIISGPERLWWSFPSLTFSDKGSAGIFSLKRLWGKEVGGGVANWREAKEGVIDGGEMTGRRGAEDGCGS